MRNVFGLLLLLLALLPLSAVHAQSVYRFAPEIQTVLANPNFLDDLRRAGSWAGQMDREVEIRHVTLNVGTNHTTVNVILAATANEGARKGELIRAPLNVLSYPVNMRENGTFEVGRGTISPIFTLPKNLEVFPPGLSAILVDSMYGRMLFEIWANLLQPTRDDKFELAPIDVVVQRGEISSATEGSLEIGTVNRVGSQTAMWFGSIQAQVWRQSRTEFYRADGLILSRARSTKRASVRKAKILRLPGSPAVEPANLARPDELPGKVDLVEKTKREAQKGKDRREGKVRGGKK